MPNEIIQLDQAGPYSAIMFIEDEGVFYPHLICAWCRCPIRDSNRSLIGFYDYAAKCAIALHMGDCDRKWSEAHGQVPMWHHSYDVMADLVTNIGVSWAPSRDEDGNHKP